MNELNKMWNMHAIDYYQVIKRNFFFFFLASKIKARDRFSKKADFYFH